MFHIRFDNEDGSITYYRFSAVTGAEAVFSGKASSNPVESGKNISDHYISENDTLSLTGYLTSVDGLSAGVFESRGNSIIKVPTNNNTKTFIDTLKARKENTELCTVYFDKQTIKNCVFTAIKVSKVKAVGVNDWIINISVKALNLVDKATVTQQIDREHAIALATKVKENKAKQKVVNEEKANKEANYTLDNLSLGLKVSFIQSLL